MTDRLKTLRTTYTAKQSYKFLDILGMIFVGLLMINTFAGVKLIDIGPFILPGTILIYPFIYIFADIFTEVYGYQSSRRIIWTGLFLLALSTSLLYLISILTPSKIWADQEAFSKIFQTAPIYTLATIVSYFSGEFTNSYVLAKLKIKMKGKRLWVRTIGSTIVGTAVDNAMYSFIAYIWFYSFGDVIWTIFSGWFFCVAYESLVTPVTYRVVSWLKQAEGVDIYDRGTDFNPFHLSFNESANKMSVARG